MPSYRICAETACSHCSAADPRQAVSDEGAVGGAPSASVQARRSGWPPPNSGGQASQLAASSARYAASGAACAARPPRRHTSHAATPMHAYTAGHALRSAWCGFQPGCELAASAALTSRGSPLRAKARSLS